MKRAAEVVIVGGGCMGASVAYHLARRGVTDVVLLEREKMLATGSTGRNAGGVRHQFSNEANIRLSIESIALLERFADEVGHPIDFHQDGYLFLLSSPSSVETFRQNVALQRRLGVDVQWLDAREAGALAPGLSTDGVLAATFCGRDGIADPNGVTMGFAKTAQSLGVTVERDVEVTGISAAAGRVAAVETTRGTIETRTVVNAAGPYARLIGTMAGAAVPVDPIRRHIFIAAPGTGQAALQVPSSHIMVIDFETTFYFHREGPGIVFGGREEALEDVAEHALRRMPLIAELPIQGSWWGYYEVSPDHNAIVGESPGTGRFLYATGFSGHGFQQSPAIGEHMAQLVRGEQPTFDLSGFAVERFARGEQRAERFVV
jgi:sarcosine oxidase subunit beta